MDFLPKTANFQGGGYTQVTQKTPILANQGNRQRARVPPTLSPTNLPITHQTLSILSNQNTYRGYHSPNPLNLF
jgi:hypothetical protein